MTGTPNQVEWAVRIRHLVNAEFDRVAGAFRTVAMQQSDARRADTQAILQILEEQRTAAVSREDAGYFIHDWQEIGDQVRQAIFRDSRYQKIKAAWAEHRPLPAQLSGKQETQ